MGKPTKVKDRPPAKCEKWEPFSSMVAPESYCEGPFDKKECVDCNRSKELPHDPLADHNPVNIPARQPEPLAPVKKPFTAEIEFPAIADLKQAVIFDKGTLILVISFKARIDNPFDLFRLANILKQRGGALWAKLGTNQATMDFAFDPNENYFEVITPEQIEALESAMEKEDHDVRE